MEKENYDESKSLGWNKDIDQNKIVQFILLKYLLIILKLLVLVINFSYFIGLMFYIISIGEADFNLDLDFNDF